MGVDGTAVKSLPSGASPNLEPDDSEHTYNIQTEVQGWLCYLPVK